MNSIDDDFVLKCLSGSLIFIKDICAFKNLTLRQIAQIGYTTFFSYLQVLTMDKPMLDLKKENKQVNDYLSSLSTFQYFLMMCGLDQNFNKMARDAFRTLLGEKQIFFSLQAQQILFGPINQQHILNEEDFYILQTYLKKAYCLESQGQLDLKIQSTDDQRVRALKEKMARGRQAAAKAKAKQNGGQKSNIHFSDLVASVAVSVPGLNMINIWDLTYYAFQDQLKRMSWRQQYDMNTRAALAGAKIDKKKMAHWIRHNG